MEYVGFVSLWYHTVFHIHPFSFYHDIYRVFQYKCPKINGNSTNKIYDRIYFFLLFIIIIMGHLQIFLPFLFLVLFKCVMKGTSISPSAGIDLFLHKSDNILYFIFSKAFSKFLHDLFWIFISAGFTFLNLAMGTVKSQKSSWMKSGDLAGNFFIPK